MSQRYKQVNSTRKRDQKFVEKTFIGEKQIKGQSTNQSENQNLQSSAKKRRWIEEFTQNQTNNLKRKRIFVDLIELQHYGGLALCSNHVVNFKIVGNEKEMVTDSDSFFNPKFSHQIFHKDETVRGYKDLNIDIFLSQSCLRPFVNLTYTKKAENHDDILGTLRQHFGDCLITDRQQFIQYLKEEQLKFKPFGKKVGQFERQLPIKTDLNAPQVKAKRSVPKLQLETKVFEIYKIDAGNERFNELNRRLQALFIFFIDGASFIALDGNWSYFLVYQNNKLVAYSTVYEQKKPFLGKTNPTSAKAQSKYTYKLRISQFIVLPPYQRFGIGSTLLESMYNFYLADKKCTEITVEDPSEDFQQMKDALDIKMIWKNGFFQSFRKVFKGKSTLKTAAINRFNFDQLILDQQEILDIQQAVKLKKQNILRCYELIILSKLDHKDPLVHQKFAQEVKRKFYYQMNKNLLQPYFQLENFYGSIIPHNQYYDDQHQKIRVIKSCCDGDGKVVSDEHSQLFEQQMSKYQHHHHYQGPSSGNSLGPLEYQRVYNKFTPTPMANHGLLYNNFQGKPMQWPQLFGATPRFELPENLQNKILRIICGE